MDYARVQGTINDLPPTFKRPDPTYLALVDSFSNGLYRFTQAAWGTTNQLKFGLAAGGWLDVYGLLFGIPRFAMEPDSTYAARIMFQVLAGAGPPLQIQQWVQLVWHQTIQVVESFPNVGYILVFGAGLTPQQIQQIVLGLAYVRPAGVPFTAMQSAQGTYLNTINFLNESQVIGAYLAGDLLPVPFTALSSTNNAQPILPDLFLTDTTLNPSLAI